MEKIIKLNWYLKILVKTRYKRKLLIKFNQERSGYTDKKGYSHNTPFPGGCPTHRILL